MVRFQPRRLLLALLIAAFTVLCVASAAFGLALRVRGNRLVEGKGKVIRLIGVNRSGAEYSCIQGYGFFDGPTGARSIRAMKRWRINAVRVPLNEDCWLGINGVKPQLGGGAYRAAIEALVGRLNRAGLYVILDLHVAAPGSERSVGIIPLPDADHAPDFWRSVGATFASNHSLAFDLYNEPHDVAWDCWLSGCDIAAGGSGTERHPAYRAAGMQQLLDAVRLSGAQQPVLAGGRAYARDLSGWLEHRPVDPAGQLVASDVLEVRLRSVLTCSAIGSPATARREFAEFVDRAKPDEVMVTAQIFDHAARLRSYELLMNAVGSGRA